MVRRLKLLISQALMGIMMPMTSRKPVVSHWTVELEMLKRFINVG